MGINEECIKKICRKRTQILISKDVIKRKEVCEVCGNTSGGTWNPIYCHHRNYQDPTDIQWLCRECHSKIHSNGNVIPWEPIPNIYGDISSPEFSDYIFKKMDSYDIQLKIMEEKYGRTEVNASSLGEIVENNYDMIYSLLKQISRMANIMERKFFSQLNQHIETDILKKHPEAHK